MPISRSIIERCQNPYETRRRADRGLTVPCPTGCMAYEPGTARGCLFVNRGQRVQAPADVPRVSPLRSEERQLMMVLPTAEMSGEPGPTIDPPEKEKP